MKFFSLRETNKILFAIFIFLLVIAIVSFLPIAKKNNPRIITAPIINQKDVNEIFEFLIYNGKETFVLQRDNSKKSRCVSGEVVFPAAESIVEELIIVLTRNRKIRIVGETRKNQDNYGLSGKSSHRISYAGGDIFFGADLTKSKVYLSVGDGNIYETENDIERFLTLPIEKWAEPSLVPRAIFGETRYDDVQYISFSSQTDGNRLLKPGTKKFQDAAQKILELRHGGISSAKKIEEDNADFNFVLSLGNGDGNFLFLVFFKEADGSYLVSHVLSDVLLSSQNLAQAQNNGIYNFSAKISAWTMNNIIGMF